MKSRTVRLGLGGKQHRSDLQFLLSQNFQSKKKIIPEGAAPRTSPEVSGVDFASTRTNCASVHVQSSRMAPRTCCKLCLNQDNKVWPHIVLFRLWNPYRQFEFVTFNRNPSTTKSLQPAVTYPPW